MRRQVVWTVNSMTYVQVCEALNELTPGDHDFEHTLVTLLVGGVGQPLAVSGVGKADRADGAIEGHVRD